MSHTPDLAPSLPSTLFRVRHIAVMGASPTAQEEVGSGPLSKMIRLALSDPDREVWRYSIKVAGRVLASEEIVSVARSWDG